LLPFGGLAGADAALRLRAEAVAAGSLRHPHIVAIHEVGLHQGQHFLAMDYVAGPSLARVLRDGPLPAARAATLVRQVALAVQHAHDRGIIHRDLKPSNILLDAADDEPRVTDFGLAKNLFSDTQLTLTGQTLGSPNYIPPEQIRGSSRREDTQSKAECGMQNAEQRSQSLVTSAATSGKVSFASDVYALGAILYHTLTGRPPFQGDQISAVLQQVLYEEPLPPRRLNPSVPADLETICLKCLEKETERRYATANELAQDLDRFLSHEPIHANPITHAERAWRWCRRKPALASFIAATAILLLAVFIGSPIAVYQIDRARKAEAAKALEARQNLYAAHMNLAQQAVQEDEFDRALKLLDQHRPEFVVPASAGSGSNRSPAPADRLKAVLPTDLRGWEWRYLWLQCQSEHRFILGEHTYGAFAVGMLADGKTVFSAGFDNFVRLWNLESRREIGTLPHSAVICGAAASSDGRWLATASSADTEGQPIRLWDLATQKAATLTTNFMLRSGSIAFSPDSKWLAFGTMFGGLRIWAMNSRSEITNLPAFPAAEPVGFAFSPDSRTLAYNENEYGAILLWDIASRSVIGRLTGHESFVTALAFSPDGQTLASGSQDRTARLWNLAERREGLGFTNRTGGFTSLAFSPDGRTLAMSGAGGAGRVIRLANVATGSPKAELRGHLEDITSLAFTPDGQTLLSASEDGTIRVWDPISRAKEKSAHVFARDLISLAWRSYGPALCLSPDGRHLLAIYTNQTFSVWDTLRLAEGERPGLPFTNTTMTALAPDGRLAAFGSLRGEVMLWDVETGQPRFFAWPQTNHIHRLVFSLDGRYLAAADDTKTLSDMSATNNTNRTVRVWDVRAQKKTRVFYTDGQLPMSLTFSADAKALMAGFLSGSVKLWQLDGPGEAAMFPGNSYPVRALALLPDGQTLISMTGPDIRFWDVRTCREINKLNPRGGMFAGVALSADGRRLAAGASDGRITIWDVASRQEVVTIEGHQESVTQLAFTPDGNYLISASRDQLRVWSAPSWAHIEAAEKHARK
jgi:WD40 repeat protein